MVEPGFPIPTKSKNHKNFLPIGLLKLSSYYKNKKDAHVELVRGETLPEKFDTPDIIEITSLFTYWSEYVWNVVDFFRSQFPDSKKTEIRVGGIYATLHYEERAFMDKCKKYNAIPVKGVQEEVENFPPDYELVIDDENPINYQIVHASRGCIRNCKFCGTWILEPEFKGSNSIKPKIEHGLKLGLKNLVFYDNNFLCNPNIRNILNELAELKNERIIRWCESQSGFDGRVLKKDPELATLLKRAGFRYPRIAWDGNYNQWPDIEKQIQILIDAGFSRNDIYVFVLYNWDLDFYEMEKKRIKCWEWGVQISDCRYRPLSQLYDHYKPRKDQSEGNDYFIHPDWTDSEIKQYRKNIRRQNICIRQNFPYHSRLLENKKNYTKEQHQIISNLPIKKAKKYLPDLWIPDKITHPKYRDKCTFVNIKKPKHLPSEEDASLIMYQGSNN